jgi:ureidoglycolate dehydrogenase (NAD+)
MVDGARAGHDGHFFMAINVAGFQPVDAFKRRVDAVSRQIQRSRRKAGVERLYPPGLLEDEFQRRYASEGIPLNQETLSGIRSAAERLKVDLRLP